MRNKKKRFEEVLALERRNLSCKHCPIHKQCNELSEREENNFKYTCEDLLFAYVENGISVEEFLIGFNRYC